jgi:opacity protein-like surface antigen
MKRSCVFLAAMMLLGAAFAAAQPVPGKKFEFSTGVSFFGVKFDGSDSSYSYLSVPVRFGWFAWRGLEIEPEVCVTFPLSGDGDTSYFLLANVVYNFRPSGNLVPFVGAGAGVGNGLAVAGVVQGGSGMNTSVFDALLGVKFLIGKVGALRVEYRYNRYSWDYGDGKSEDGNLHQVLMGLAIFF